MWEAPKAPAPATVGAPKLAGVPRPVAKVMGAALSEDPGARPRDGKVLALGASLRSPAGGSPPSAAPDRRVRGSAFVLLGLAVAGFATWRVWERQIPGGRPTVAVADFVNETGEKELDSISGLLITSLEQGTQLRVLTRGRMVDVLKQLGKGAVERIDEPLAREVGQGDAGERAAARLHPQARRRLRGRDARPRPAPRRVHLHGERPGRRQGRRLRPRRPARRGDAEAAGQLRTPARPSTQGGLHHDRQPEGLGTPLPVAPGRATGTHCAEARRLAEEAVKEDPGVRSRLPPARLAAFWHEWKLRISEARSASRTWRQPRRGSAGCRRRSDSRCACYRAIVDGAPRRCRSPLRGSRRRVPTRQGRRPPDRRRPLALRMTRERRFQYFERVLQLDPDQTLGDRAPARYRHVERPDREVPPVRRARAPPSIRRGPGDRHPRRRAKATNADGCVALLAAGKDEARDSWIGLLGFAAARIHGPPLVLVPQLPGAMAEAEAEVRAAFARVERPRGDPEQRSKASSAPVERLQFLYFAWSVASRRTGRVRTGPENAGELAPASRPNVALTKGRRTSSSRARHVMAPARPPRTPRRSTGDGARTSRSLEDKVRSRARGRARVDPGLECTIPELDWRRAGDGHPGVERGEDGGRGRAHSPRTSRGTPPSDRYFGHVNLAGDRFHFTSGDCPRGRDAPRGGPRDAWPSQPLYRPLSTASSSTASPPATRRWATSQRRASGTRRC